MLFLPVSRWFEEKGLARGLAILVCVLLFLAIVVGIVWLITWQVTDLTSDVGNIEKKVKEMIDNLKRTINKNFGITPKQQDELLKSSQGSQGGISSFVSGFGSGMMSFVVDFILVLVYIFLFMYYRGHIKKFILQLIPARQKGNAEEVVSGIQKVSQQYLTGLGLMIVGLWIMYSIGFSIVGVQYPVFFCCTMRFAGDCTLCGKPYGEPAGGLDGYYPGWWHGHGDRRADHLCRGAIFSNLYS